MGAASETTSDARSSAILFHALWAASVLFHIGSYGIWAISPAPAIAALLLLGNPRSLPRLLLLACAVLADAFQHSPYISNHWLFACVPALSILLAYGLLAARSRSPRVEIAALYRAFGPMARASLMVLYLYVVLHKLNHDYLFSEGSCGAVFYRAQRDVFGFLPGGSLFELSGIYGTVLVEMLIPLLLAIPATRALGVLVGVVFHVIISFNPLSGFFNFSSMLFALYALFLPERFAGRLRSALREHSVFEQLRGVRWGVVLAALPAAIVAIFVWQEIALERGNPAAFLVLWIPYSGAGIVAAVLAWRWHRDLGGPQTAAFRMAASWCWIVPLAVLLNGFSPYLGLKTDLSFAMFSNLRTEGGVTNHLFIPTSTQIFDYQRDLVAIEQAALPGLQELAVADKRLPYAELRRRVAPHPQSSLTFRRGGQRVSLVRVDEDPELSAPLSLLHRKWLRFRAIDASGPQECAH